MLNDVHPVLLGIGAIILTLLAAAFHNWLYDSGVFERQGDDGKGDFG